MAETANHLVARYSLAGCLICPDRYVSCALRCIRVGQSLRIFQRTYLGFPQGIPIVKPVRRNAPALQTGTCHLLPLEPVYPDG